MSFKNSTTFDQWLSLSGLALALTGLLAGTHQFARTQAFEAARPFLEKKLQWCEEVVELAAEIAVHGRDSLQSPSQAGTAIKRVDRFWVMYWGVAGMVEARELVDAIVTFGDGLKNEKPRSDNMRALGIALACRMELARTWSAAWNED